MNWYYVQAGQQAGPVDDAGLEELVRAGQVQPDTLVWYQGLANWQPYQQVRPATASASAEPPLLAPPVAAPAAGGVVCCECGRSFAPDQVVRFGDRYVCAACKPVFVQRLAEGAPLGAGVAGGLSEADLLSRDYRIEIGECLERGWRLFTARPGLIMGTLLVIGLLAVVVYGGALVVSLVVPFFNSLVGLILSGPLMGGILWFFLRLARGEAAELSDVFAGFQRRFVQLMLCSVVQGLLNIACLLPVGLAAAGLGLAGALGGRNPPEELALGLVVVLAVCGLLGAAAITYLTTLWTFSLLLVMDKGLDFWPAMQLSRRMVSRRWWMTFLFLLVAGLIMGAGALACGVGLLVSVPVYYAMKVYLYEDNFRDLAAQPR